MNKRALSFVINAVVGLMAPAAFAQQPPPAMGHAARLALVALPPKADARLTVSSPAFKDGSDIPFANTQYRGNVFPGLTWSRGPGGTRSYVVIMQGESLDGTNTSIHLTLFNAPATVTRLAPGMTAPPGGALYGPNVHGLNQPYAGPHTHTPAKQRYHLQVFALDSVIESNSNLSFESLEAAMAGHVLASGELIGWAAMDPGAAAR